METLFQKAKVSYRSPVRVFIFLSNLLHPDSYRDYIYPGFNFLHFACGRLPKARIEKRREEKRRKHAGIRVFAEGIPMGEVGFSRKLFPP